MRKSDKLTKQGVRDLGGNRRPPPDEHINLRTFDVDISDQAEGHSGITLHIEAASAREALRHAQRQCRDLQVALLLRPIQIRLKQRIVWDQLNGFL